MINSLGPEPTMTIAARTTTLTIHPIKSILFNLKKPHLQPQTLSKPPLNPQKSHPSIIIPPFNPKPMSILSSIHLLSKNSIPKLFLPPSNSPIFTPLKIQSLPSKPSNFPTCRYITIERLSVNPIYSSSINSQRQPIEELPFKLQEIVKLFQAVEEPKAKYEQLLFYGRNLRPLGNEFKNNDNKVKGCVSQVWVRAYLDDDNKNVIFEADSDSMLTKGLAALLVQGLSGRPVEEIVRVSPDFVTLLGLQQSLTPSRNNGFLNMLKLMQKKALQLYVEAEKANELRGNERDNGIVELDLEVKNENVSDGVSDDESFSGLGSDFGDDGLLGSRGMRIKEVLGLKLRPVELVVEDISYQHAGHAGVRGSDGETHFNVKVVSGEFEGKSMVKRHRMIYELLQDELQNGLHALSIVAKTPSEVEGN